MDGRAVTWNGRVLAVAGEGEVVMGAGGLLGVAATPLMSAQMVKQEEEKKEKRKKKNGLFGVVFFFLSFLLSLRDET